MILQASPKESHMPDAAPNGFDRDRQHVFTRREFLHTTTTAAIAVASSGLANRSLGIDEDAAK